VCVCTCVCVCVCERVCVAHRGAPPRPGGVRNVTPGARDPRLSRPYLFLWEIIFYFVFLCMYSCRTAREAFRHGFYSILFAPVVYINCLLCTCHTFISLLP
jgi:hypothetical protein